MWGATARHEVTTQSHEVSIHAPRVGCDPRWESSRREPRCFNSRTPCGVRQLTDDQKAELTSFNSRTPCGVRHDHPYFIVPLLDVSIHAPRVGCDIGANMRRSRTLRFQFTHPVWGATRHHRRSLEGRNVSIHAPRVGCDLVASRWHGSNRRFNSRTPCGVRPPTDKSLKSPSYVSIHAPRVGCDNRRLT